MNNIILISIISILFISCDNKTNKTKPNSLKKYTGTFIVLPGWKLRIIARNNHLKIKAGNQIYRKLIKTDENAFRYENLNAYLQFYEHEGRIDSLVLSQVASRKFTEDTRNEIVGTYKTTNGFSFIITNENYQYFAKTDGTPKYIIRANKFDKYIYDVSDSFYTFENIDSTQTKLLKLHEPAKRRHKPIKINHNQVDLPLQQLKSKVGKYIISDRLTLEITLSNNQLYSQITGEEKFRIFPSAKNKFFFKVMNGEIEFTYDINNTINGLKLFRLDEFLPAVRVND